MAAFSCDSVGGGGVQPLKHWGGASSSGVWQFCARDWAKHTWLGRSGLALTEQIVWPAAAQGQPPVPPLSTAPGPPPEYGPPGFPPLNPRPPNAPLKRKCSAV